MVDAFCNSHFSYQEKRDLFFPEKPVICRTCHHPRVKKKINLGDFSANLQNMICMLGAPLGGDAAAGVHGVHMNPHYVTRNEFNLFRTIVFNGFQLIINNMQQMRQDINQNMNQVEQMRGDINQIQQNMNQIPQLINQAFQQNINQLMNGIQQNVQNQINQALIGLNNNNNNNN